MVDTFCNASFSPDWQELTNITSFWAAETMKPACTRKDLCSSSPRATSKPAALRVAQCFSRAWRVPPCKQPPCKKCHSRGHGLGRHLSSLHTPQECRSRKCPLRRGFRRWNDTCESRNRHLPSSGRHHNFQRIAGDVADKASRIRCRLVRGNVENCAISCSCTLD